MVNMDGTSSPCSSSRDRVHDVPRHRQRDGRRLRAGRSLHRHAAMFSVARGLALLLNDQLPVSLLDLNGGSFGDPRPFSLLWFGNGRIGGIRCRSTSSSGSR